MSDTSNKIESTIEEILGMTREQLIALTPEQLTTYLTPVLEQREAIVRSIPRRTSGGERIALTVRESRGTGARSGSPAVTAALMKGLLEKHGVSAEMAKQLGLKGVK